MLAEPTGQFAKIQHWIFAHAHSWVQVPAASCRKLESNRGNYSKFLIESAEFNKANPYPKGHTCFNRLELPKYQTKDQLKTFLTAIVNNNLDGVFGLD